MLCVITCEAIAQPQDQGAQDAADTAAATPALTISADVARSRLQAIEANSNLDEAVRTRVADEYRQILTDLDASKSLKESRQQWLDKIEKLPEQRDAVDRQLKDNSSDISAPQTANLTQEQLDKKVTELQTESSAAQSKLAALKAEPKRRSDRRLEAPKQIANLLTTQAELQRRKTELQSRTDMTSEERKAQQSALDIKLANVDFEIQTIRDELAFYDAAEDVLNKEIELQEKTVAQDCRRVESVGSRRRAYATGKCSPGHCRKDNESSRCTTRVTSIGRRQLEAFRTAQTSRG